MSGSVLCLDQLLNFRQISKKLSAMESKDLDVNFLLQLLKEERNRRHTAESEVNLLRTLLGPSQQKELDHITKAKENSLRDSRIKSSSHSHRSEASISELGTYVQNKFPTGGKIVCDCGDSDCGDSKSTVGYDIVG